MTPRELEAKPEPLKSPPCSFSWPSEAPGDAIFLEFDGSGRFEACENAGKQHAKSANGGRTKERKGGRFFTGILRHYASLPDWNCTEFHLDGPGGATRGVGSDNSGVQGIWSYARKEIRAERRLAGIFPNEVTFGSLRYITIVGSRIECQMFVTGDRHFRNEAS